MRHGSFTIDAFFLTVKEGVDEMIKFLANEPSVGLFFVQQHAQTSMPYLLDINDKVGAKIHEVTLEIEDTKDSICSINSMREHGIPIAEEMIKDINKSLNILSASQSKRWLVGRPSSGAQITSSTLQDSSTTSDIRSDEHARSSRSYFFTAFSSAKLKAGLRWPQPDIMAMVTKSDHLPSATPSPATRHPMPTSIDAESEGLPLPSRPSGDEVVLPVEGLYTREMSSVLQDYDNFKAEREAKYVEWLAEPKNSSKCDDEGID